MKYGRKQQRPHTVPVRGTRSKNAHREFEIEQTFEGWLD